MKEEDFERFEKGRDLWTEILSSENVLAEIDEALQRKNELREGLLYTASPGLPEIRIRLDVDVVIRALETMKAKHEEIIKEWKRQFEAL